MYMPDSDRIAFLPRHTWKINATLQAGDLVSTSTVDMTYPEARAEDNAYASN